MQMPHNLHKEVIHETIYLLLLIPLIGHAEEAIFGFAADVSVSGFLAQKLVK